MKIITTVILLLDIFIEASAWPCVHPIRNVYRSVTTDALLQFTADLTDMIAVRQFSVKFHDDTLKGWIRYNPNKTYTTDSLQNVTIKGDTSGKVNVTLKHVVKSSAGIYMMSCTGFETICSCLYILGSLSKPNITLTGIASVGKNSTLQCSSTSSTTPSNHSLGMEYSWKVNDTVNPKSTRYSYSDNKNTLTLADVVKDDANIQFKCNASENVDGGFTSGYSDPFSLDVHYGPDTVTINVSSPYYITEGDKNVNIECSSMCHPGCSYVWKNLTRRSIIIADGTLSFPNVIRYLAGDYKCTSSNTAQEYTKSSEKTISVVVQYAPDVSVHLSTSNIIEGESLELYCNGTGVPSIYKYTNLRQMLNNIEIPNENTAVTGTQIYSSINFLSLKLEDTGTYTCILNNAIKNTLGILDQVGSMNILVKVRPKIMTKELRFTGSTGGTSHIELPIYSFPPVNEVTITRYDGIIVPYNMTGHVVRTTFYGKSVSLNGSRIDFVIQNLKEEDFGNYTFQLINELGASNITVFVIAEGKPLPPNVFQFISDHSTPTFLWQKSFNGGPDQSFVIQTSVAGTDQWTNRTNIHEGDSNYRINSSFYKATISGLLAGVYTARIFAINRIGESDFVELGKSFEVIIQDDSSVPVGAIVGALCTAVVVLITAGLVVAVLRRTRKKETCRDKFDTKNSPDEDDESEVNTVNPMYIPADTIQPTDSTYAQPVKTRKPAETAELYAVVEKKAKTGKKDHKNDRKQKKPTSAMSSSKNKEKNTNGEGCPKEENLYENPLPDMPKESKKPVNKEGLIYADLAFNPQSKGHANIVIHGADSMTEYGEVDFTKKAEPLPDSDEEDNKMKT